MHKIKQIKFIRFLICAIRIPYIYFSLRGHITRRGPFSVDRDGQYLPWFTYPFIDYMNNLDLADCTVFEFGAGSSSFWWAQRAAGVISVEMDKGWFEFLRNSIPSNVQVALCQDGGRYPEVIAESDSAFDIVVVDGAERYKCAVKAVSKLSERGVIVLDNSDWYLNTAKMLRDNDFVQLDFYGFSPNNSFPTVTSLFYKDDTLLRRRRSTPVSVIGGNTIAGGVLDDG